MDGRRHLRKVGQNIKLMRLRKGLRQVDVIERLGLNYRHYQDIEAGKVNLTLTTLCRLAKQLDVPLEQLIQGICD